MTATNLVLAAGSFVATIIFISLKRAPVPEVKKEEKPPSAVIVRVAKDFDSLFEKEKKIIEKKE